MQQEGKKDKIYEANPKIYLKLIPGWTTVTGFLNTDGSSKEFILFIYNTESALNYSKRRKQSRDAYCYQLTLQKL